jgi:hypothetical protein
MRRQLVGLAAVLTLLCVILLAGPRPASAETIITAAPVENAYPKSLTFKMTATADQEITDATLRYVLKNRATSGIGKPESFTPGKSVSTTVVVETNPNTNWLPIGNELTWHWELTLADGSTFSSKDDTYLYLPTNHDWKNASNELMTVYYYGDRSGSATRFLAAATDTYTKVGKSLLKTQLRKTPVKVVLVVDSKEVEESQPSKGTTFQNSGIITCGYRPGSADDIIVVAATCGGASSVDTLRHEFGHIINLSAGESTLVKLPSWLDEGLAVYAQESPADFLSAFQATVRQRKDILAFERLASPPSDPNQTLLFYGQSYVMTKYLIDTYGADKLAALLALTKASTRFDVALQRTYGFDMKAFEVEFRQANNIGGSGGATPAPTTRPQQQQATPVPTQRAQPAATAPPTAVPAASNSGSNSDSLDPVAMVSVGAAILFALVAVFLYLVSQVIAQRRSAETPVQPPSHPDDWAPPRSD